MARTTKKSKRKLIVITLVLLLVAAIVVTLVVMNRNDQTKDDIAQTENSDGINYGPPTEQEKEEGEQTKLNNIENDKPVNTDGKANIKEAYQDTTTKEVVVKTELQGTGWTGCELAMTLGGTKIVKTANVLFMPEASTCMGFAVPIGEFSQGGTWTATLKATKNDGTQYSSTKEVGVTL